MDGRLSGAQRAVPATLGVLTLAAVVALLVWDAWPDAFPADAHRVLGASPLALIALAYGICQWAHRPKGMARVKTVVVAAAFLFWAANQMWPNAREATLFNDLAIALFVLDIFLLIVGWPAGMRDESLGEG